MYVREWQKYLDLTNKEVARRLNISPTTYCKYLCSDIRVSTLVRISDAFGIPVSWLFVTPPLHGLDGCPNFLAFVRAKLFDVNRYPFIQRLLFSIQSGL